MEKIKVIAECDQEGPYLHVIDLNTVVQWCNRWSWLILGRNILCMCLCLCVCLCMWVCFCVCMHVFMCECMCEIEGGRERERCVCVCVHSSMKVTFLPNCSQEWYFLITYSIVLLYSRGRALITIMNNVCLHVCVCVCVCACTCMCVHMLVCACLCVCCVCVCYVCVCVCVCVCMYYVFGCSVSSFCVVFHPVTLKRSDTYKAFPAL